MKYKVLVPFADLQDEKHIYQKDDVYPRKGLTPSDERIQFLLNTAPYFIGTEGKAEEVEVQEQVIEDEIVAKVASLEDLTVNDLKKLAEEKGIILNAKAKKADIIEVLKGE